MKKAFFIILLILVSSCSPKVIYSSFEVPVSRVQQTVDSLVAPALVNGYRDWAHIEVMGMDQADSIIIIQYFGRINHPDGKSTDISIYTNSRDTIVTIKRKEYM